MMLLSRCSIELLCKAALSSNSVAAGLLPPHADSAIYRKGQDHEGKEGDGDCAAHDECRNPVTPIRSGLDTELDHVHIIVI